MSSDRFFNELPPQKDFFQITDPSNFTPVPNDWWVVITDVRGSTKAIEAGRYKEVNMIGAASVVAILNVSRTIEIPFVFGGDGATLLVPPSLIATVRQTLSSSQALAKQEFDLELRAGCIAVSEIRAAGYDIRIAKVRLGKVHEQAMFAGGGIKYAENQIKDLNFAALYAVTPSDNIDANYEGLECRWQDIPSRKGEVVSLIVVATGRDASHNQAIYRRTLDQIRQIYGDDEACAPISVADLAPTFDLQALMREARIRTPAGLGRYLYTLRIWFLNVLFKQFIRRDVTMGDVRWRDYLELLVATSDFRKYDDALRMVISGTAEQRRQLDRYFAAGYANGEIVYGLHHTDRALMTCIVFERMGRQVHLVDGADGGLTAAARDLKERLRHEQIAAK